MWSRVVEKWKGQTEPGYDYEEVNTGGSVTGNPIRERGKKRSTCSRVSEPVGPGVEGQDGDGRDSTKTIYVGETCLRDPHLPHYPAVTREPGVVLSQVSEILQVAWILPAQALIAAVSFFLMDAEDREIRAP